MTAVAYIGAGIFDGSRIHENKALLAEAGRVRSIACPDRLPAGIRREELAGGVLAPGYVDLQANGGGGRMFNDRPGVATLRIMGEAHGRVGATTILPTLITDRPEAAGQAVDAVAQAIALDVPGIAGLHLEGPHLDPACRGAHDAGLIREMTDMDEAELAAAAGRLATLMVTFAPAAVGLDRVARLAAAGVLLSLGHAACSHADAEAAVRAGARCVTHVFNAMSQLGSREPGLVGAALDFGELDAGLIADLVHVHPATLRTALNAKRGPGELFAVTDSMAAVGSDVAEFRLNGRRVLRRDGRLTLSDGTLAGADLDMTGAVRNLVSLGLSPARALAMATSIPARVAGLTGAGRLAPGQAADMVHLDPAYRLKAVWRRGMRIL